MGIYLFTKNESFKQKNKVIKGLVSIGLAFFILIGAVFTSIIPESMEQAKLASEKAKIEQQDKQKASEDQAKKAEEEKAKQQKKDAEEKAKTVVENNNSEQASNAVSAPANNTANTASNVSANSNDSRTVYWVPKGKSYHYSKGCPTLARSKTILEGPLSECPKFDPCR